MIDRSEQLISAITEGTAPLTGAEFFRALVRHLAAALQVRFAFLAECLPNQRARTLGFWHDGELGEDLVYDLKDTPCLDVVEGHQRFYCDRLQQRFPGDALLAELGVESYHGVPMRDSSGSVVGHLVVMHDRPIPEDPLRLLVLETFAARAGAELVRVRADSRVRDLNSELDSLLAMNRAIGRHLNRDELFGALAWSLKSMVPTDRFGIELPIEGGKLQGHILNERTVHEEPTTPTVLPATGTACDWVMQRREWVVTGSLAELRDRFPVTFDVMSQAGMESLCAMPLISGERCRGALFFMAAAKEAYRRVRRGFLEHVVGAVSVAVDDCLAHEELRQLRDRLAAENVYLQEEISFEHNFEEIVGSSTALKRVFQAIEQVAGTDTTVLLQGETGTGKELFARAIHNLSSRKDRVLVKVNCAAIPHGLIESELFGHEKGAFTGAVARKIGRFELADGATVFLDEVGELPLDLQPKLLRVLQEGEFERVGNPSTLRTDVRVIAATNRDLRRAVQEGTFRADLFYRLNVFPIRLPALRERKGDIPLLVRYFAQKHGAKIGRSFDRIPQAAVTSLEDYDWPGNIRELQNIVERAVILSPGPQLDFGDWMPSLSSAEETALEPVATIEELEREHVLRTLHHTGWRVSGERGAAKLLGLKPTTLEARMKKLGITRPSRTAPAVEASRT